MILNGRNGCPWRREGPRVHKALRHDAREWRAYGAVRRDRRQLLLSGPRLRHAGVRVGFFLQFGYPGETREDIALTFKMVRDCRPDDIGVSVSYPLPGTKFFERLEAQLGAKQNWLDSDDLAMLYEGPYTTAFYRQLHSVLHKEFRARKYREELRRVFRQPQTFQRKHLRRVAALAYNAMTLPLARQRLNRLARQPHSTVVALTPELCQAAAAIPSPQLEYNDDAIAIVSAGE